MMNLIIQLVRTALCGRQEKSCVTGRLLSERLRRFGVVFLLAISVTGGFFTTPGQVRAAQGYYISSFLYLWGEDLTEQTKIPVTVADGLQTLGTGVDTLADVLKNGQLTGGPSVFKVVIAKANISGYPLLAGLSGTPSADGVFTIGDGSTNTPVSIKYTHFQNDGIVNITDASRLYDDSTGTFTNNGTINVSAWGYFVQTTSNNQLIGGVVNLSGYWDLGATKILMLPNYSSFSVQGGHFKNVVDINQDIIMTGATFHEGLVNRLSLTLKDNSYFYYFLNNGGSIQFNNNNSGFLADTNNEGSFTANGSTITMTGTNTLNNGAAVTNSKFFTANDYSAITINPAADQNAVTNTNTGSIAVAQHSTITANGVTANEGTITVDNGSTITANGVTANEGTITVANGSTIKFNDTVTGLGTITLASGANMTVGKVIQSVNTIPAVEEP